MDIKQQVALAKMLREKTGLPLMACKKVLVKMILIGTNH